MIEKPRSIVVGAGLAGLTAAVTLHRLGHAVTVIEASDNIGGRVRTDTIDRFRIDRGFQVLLTAYPETEALLSYEDLRLKHFAPGALVHHNGKLHTIADPRSRPGAALKSLASPIATPKDALALSRQLYAALTAHENITAPDITTAEFLHRRGFSPRITERFFRPFFAGVFFDDLLQTSARMFDFTFRMFAAGKAAVPALGMQQIPKQLAAHLPKHTIKLNTPAHAVTPDTVTLASGETLSPSNEGGIVLATDMTNASRLLPDNLKHLAPDRGWQSTATLAFDAPEPPTQQPILILDADRKPGDRHRPINHAAVMSNVSAEYAPAGHTLIYANTTSNPPDNDNQLEHAARKQLTRIFGERVNDWRLITTVRIPHALPTAMPGTLHFAGDHTETTPTDDAARLAVAGDFTRNGSINAAMRSGRLAARAITNARQTTS